MKQIKIFLVGVLLSLAMVNFAQANLLLDPGFEAGGGAWDLAGVAVVNTNISRAHEGIKYGEIPLNGAGSFYQDVSLPGTGGPIEFGAYLNIFTNYLGGNWDQVQITLYITDTNKNTLGGSIGNLDSNLFTLVEVAPGNFQYQTGWFLLSGTLDVLAGAPVAGFTINLQFTQAGGSAPITGFRVDDAFVQTVPEPSTLLLLGSGLLGLLGYGRRQMKK